MFTAWLFYNNTENVKRVCKFQLNARENEIALCIMSERILKFRDVFITLGGGGQIKASVALFSACVSSSLTILCSFTCAPHHRPGSWEIVKLL